MVIETRKITQTLLDEYSRVSIGFIADSIYELDRLYSGLEGIRLREISVDRFEKNYDTESHNPSHLKKKFDTDNWRVITAVDQGEMIAGAIIAYNTNGINLLEGKQDLALLWDLRVNPDYRGQNIGTKIINEVKSWAIEQQCTRVKIETQNINVKACKFYVKQGAILTGYNMHCYNDNPDEIQFIWTIYLER